MKFPAVTVACAGVAVLVQAWPALADALVYDRGAILSGELWRVVSGTFVHFSPSHLFWDVLVFVAAGVSVEAKRRRELGWSCLLGAVAPGLFLLLAAPEVARFGGLSGLASGAFVLACLTRLDSAERGRGVWLLLLALVAGKVAFELVTGESLFVAQAGTPFRVLPSAHLLGCAAAVATFWWAGSREKRQAREVNTAVAPRA